MATVADDGDWATTLRWHARGPARIAGDGHLGRPGRRPSRPATGCSCTAPPATAPAPYTTFTGATRGFAVEHG